MRRLNNLDGTRRKGHAARLPDRKAVLRRWTAIVEWRHLADWPLSRGATGCNGSIAPSHGFWKQPLRWVVARRTAYAGPRSHPTVTRTSSRDLLRYCSRLTPRNSGTFL